MMNIVHVNFADDGGGAPKASFRLHSAMRKSGLNSRMLVVKKRKNIDNIETTGRITDILKNKLYRGINKISNILSKTKGSWSNNLYGLDLSNHPLIRTADIIYLHWINAGTLSLKSLHKLLLSEKKIYLFAHDMWYMTGGCHYSMSCNKFKTQCCDCIFKAIKIPFFDVAKTQFNKKLSIFKNHPNLSICSPSEWLGCCFKESRIFNGIEVITTRNVIDPDIYKLEDTIRCREILNLSIKKKIIGFGADSVSNIYKGWNDLLEAITLIGNADIEYVIFGNVNKKDLTRTDDRFHFLGSITDEKMMVKVYNACDVIVCPSLADNFPNVIIEAMSCGTPVVANGVGGIVEMIDHKKTGYISEPHNIISLANGIKWILNHNINKSIIRESALNLSSEKKIREIHQYLYDYIEKKSN